MMRRGVGRGPARRGMMRRHRRMRRRMRRRILIGGLVVVGVGTAAYKLTKKDTEQIEQHTGKPVEDLSEEEMNQAMDDLGIEGEEVTDSDMAQLEAADDAANAAAAAPPAPAADPAAAAPAAAAPPPAAAAPAQDDYLAELEKLADLHEKGILTDEEFSAKKKQLLGL